MLSPFLSCLTEELTKRGYGDKRQAEIVDRFEGLREAFEHNGAADPDTLAMAQTLAELQAATAAKARVDYATLQKIAKAKENIARPPVNTALVGKQNENSNPALIINAYLSRDARFGDIRNVEMQQTVYRDQLWAIGNDVIEHAAKGLMGVQRGKAYLNNMIDEVFGKATGDATAAQLAKSWKGMSDAVVDLMNNVGGAMAKIDRWGLPQAQSVAKVIRTGGDKGATWINDHMKWLDWDRMRWPNGAPIKPEDRAGVLAKVYETLSSDGVVKLKDSDFQGNGKAVGNMLDNHRFMIFKDGQAWREMHAKYGDGTVFDVMTNYIDHMAHRIATTDVLSANPENFANTLKSMAVVQANEQGGVRMAKEAGAIIKNRFEPMLDATLRRNPMDPESRLGNGIMAAAGVLRAAQLSGSVLMAAPGDLLTTATWAMASGMKDNLPGIVNTYVQGFFKPTEMSRLAAHYGVVMDETVHSNFIKSRFTGQAEYGPAWSKRVSEATIRASGMTVHTNSLRFAVQSEFMHMMARDIEKDFADLASRPIMERYGIDADMWARIQKLEPDAADRIRPFDLLKNDTVANREAANAFMTMIQTESRYAVPDTTMEASILLNGGLRPDTLRGALLHSVAMYKNFPATIALMYGRTAMSMPNRTGRLAYIAGVGTSLVMAGAAGIQLREMSKGHDPLPMTGDHAVAFWGKALLASGAMSVWGDFIFGGVNNPQSTADIIGGPILGMANDTAQLAFGSMFDWADKMGTLKADKEARTPWAAKLVEYASRYTPGVNNPLIRTAVQREIFDSLRLMSNPRGYSQMMQKERARVKQNGNASWWGPGENAPSRGPDLGAALGAP